MNVALLWTSKYLKVAESHTVEHVGNVLPLTFFIWVA